MPKTHAITLLGTGVIARFYTETLHGERRHDRVHHVFSQTEERAKQFAGEWGIPRWTTDLNKAISDPDTDIVVIGLPNDLHLKTVEMAAEAGKAILCTKPLGRNAGEAKKMLEIAGKKGVFAGYLEDLVYPPKTVKSIQAVNSGSLGKVICVRSREAHPGPHSAWFLDPKQAGGGSLIDMGCHCVEIIRSFVGKNNKPVEVMCWADTVVHPIDAEDYGIGLVKFESGAIGQFEVSWAFHGGMDLRDEVAGTEGTIWINHWLRTGFEQFTTAGRGGYVSEKTEQDSGWLFPVGDEIGELGYRNMFVDMLDALDEGREPVETFYDGYVVNAVIDAAYASVKSRQWEPVKLDIWRGEGKVEKLGPAAQGDGKMIFIKEERMPDGRLKRIFRDKNSGENIEKIVG